MESNSGGKGVERKRKSEEKDGEMETGSVRRQG